MAHPYVELARKSIESCIKYDKVLEAPSPLPNDIKEKAGVFVSLHIGKELRGCIGTFAPTKENIAQEIIANAISASTQDPRFPPVELNEIDDLDISVDVLSPSIKIDNTEELDPKKYGVIVKSGWRRGLLLPDLEGVDTVNQQISICRQKAGISDNEPIELFKFEVKRYH